MNKSIDQFDIQAESESIAISNSYKPKTMDFGKRKHKDNIPPVMLRKVISRKVCRNRNSRQIDIPKEKLRERAKTLTKQKQTELIQL